LGSDEFAILIEDCAGPAHLSGIADRVHRALGEPITVEPWPITLRARLGMAQAPAGAAAGLLGHAEQALSDAEHRDQPSAWYDPDTPRETATHPRGVQAEDFATRYHPVVDLADGNLCALSLELRYRHPVLQDLDPDQVVDLTGDSSWLPEVFGEILQRCCAHATSWPAAAQGPPSLIVRLPGALIQASSPRVVEQVRTALDRSGLPADRLAVEIPERFATSRTAYVYSLASELHAHRVRIGISDFGTGFANLGYLRSLPLHAVSFDPGVIQGLAKNDPDPSTLEVLRAMVSIAGALDLRTVAREVTSARVRRRLADLGVGYAHGPGVGDALTPDQITAPGPAVADATTPHDR
jgi:EAL domain-containing protein (putative c-di-GMP-specific phosphodiesterase class I)